MTAAPTSTGKTQRVEIQDVGGVASLSLVLRPGVNLLVGPNGSGKTSAINAISRALGAKIPLEPRDGVRQGTVEISSEQTGEVVSLAVRGVVRASGEADVRLADTGVLAQLIDPGLKDEAAANRARIRALLTLVRLPITEERLRALAGGDEGVAKEVLQEAQEGAIADLLEAAERVRQTAHAMARDAEKTALETEAEIHVFEETAGRALQALGGHSKMTRAAIDFLLSPIDPETARAMFETALRDQQVVAHTAHQRASLERRQEEIRASLGGDPPDPTRFDDDIAIRRETLVAHRDRVERIRAELAETQRRLAAEQASIQMIEQDLASLETRRREEEHRARHHEDAVAILRQPVTGPGPEDIEKAAAIVAAAREEMARAASSAEYRDAHREAESRRTRAAEAAERAKTLREVATTVHDRLGAVLQGTDARGFTVLDGKLAVVDAEGAVHDFESRRSEGQRIAAALDVAASAYAGRVVPLDGRYWNALDGDAQARLAALAQERGLYLITETPGEGALHVEHVLGTAKVA